MGNGDLLTFRFFPTLKLFYDFIHFSWTFYLLFTLKSEQRSDCSETLFRDPWLYTNSSMDHKDSYLGNSGKASNPTNTPLPETPRYSAYSLTQQRQESMIQTASKLLYHLSSLGFIWRMRIWLLRQTHFHTYSPQPAGTVLILRPSTVSMETTIIWGPSWTVDSTHLILNSRKRQGWRQIPKVCGKWFSVKHRTTKNLIFNGLRIYPGRYQLKSNSTLKTQSVDINTQGPWDHLSSCRWKKDFTLSLVQCFQIFTEGQSYCFWLYREIKEELNRILATKIWDNKNEGELTVQPSVVLKMGSLLGLCNLVKLNMTNE